jgi:beta-glucosidase
MLKGFQRLSLQPGETRTVKFALHSDDLALYDLSFRRVVEPGTFTIFAGGNSMATLQTRFEVTGHPAVLAPATPRPQ